MTEHVNAPQSPNLASLRTLLASRQPGESMQVPKSQMPELPTEFTETKLGTPLWIAHPGAKAQYRAHPAVHAYEMEHLWDLHRDQFDPHDNPLQHALFDAPELLFAALIAGLAAVATYLLMSRREEEKPEENRNWWWPLVVTLVVAILAGIAAYILGALVRVAAGVG